jgi:hypothetical protein
LHLQASTPRLYVWFRPDYNEMLSKLWELIRKYNPNKILIDGSNPSFIRSLKIQIGEDSDYNKVIARYKSRKLDDRDT